MHKSVIHKRFQVGKLLLGSSDTSLTCDNNCPNSLESLGLESSQLSCQPPLQLVKGNGPFLQLLTSIEINHKQKNVFSTAISSLISRIINSNHICNVLPWELFGLKRIIYYNIYKNICVYILYNYIYYSYICVKYREN